jgi:hypothetical protein
VALALGPERRAPPGLLRPGGTIIGRREPKLPLLVFDVPQLAREHVGETTGAAAPPSHTHASGLTWAKPRSTDAVGGVRPVLGRE